jgi:hypothetical protein
VLPRRAGLYTIRSAAQPGGVSYLPNKSRNCNCCSNGSYIGIEAPVARSTA